MSDPPVPSLGLAKSATICELTPAMAILTDAEPKLHLPLASCIRPLTVVPGDKDADFTMDEQQKLMLQLLHEVWVKGTRSSWLPYLRTLPRSFPTLPLWYTPEEKRFLRGTSVDTLLEGSHIANDKDLSAMQQWCQRHMDFFPKSPSLEQLRWAASVVASRAFDSTAKGVILAPFADALNHSGVPHTRMRDCGDHLVFHAEREIMPTEEIMNCYGLQGNTQWLMNGGFLDQSRECDDLLVTPADVVSAVLEQRARHEGDDEGKEVAEDEDEEDEEDEEDKEDQDTSLCSRLSWLQDHGIGSKPFSLSSMELLPDDLATMILVIFMNDSEYLSYQQQRAAGRDACIDLGGTEGEELGERLLAHLYGSLLRLVALLRQRYETSLEEVQWCFSCDRRQAKYKVTCRQPCCEKYRGKVFVCVKCAGFCPNCEVRLGGDDIQTASGGFTRETFPSLRTVEEQGDNVMADPLQDRKGKGDRNKGKGKGGSGPKGRGKPGGHEATAKAGGICVVVPGYAIGTVIGQNGAQLDQLRSEHPGVSISLRHMDKEETFAGQRSHHMELSISGLDPQAVDHVKSRVEILIDRAGASHKPPQEQTVLVDVEHAGHARLAHADLRAFHVCPIEFKKTTTGSNRKYFVLQKVLDMAEHCNIRGGNARYAYSSNRRNWNAFVPDFHKFQEETPMAKLSCARVSVRFGQLFFWGPKLSHGDAQKPGAINQMSYKDCRGQFAARLTSAVVKKFTDNLQKSEFEKFQQLLNITFYIKPEGDGEKREITFNDPNGSAKRRAEIERLWACKSYTEVLQLSEEQGRTSSRVQMAVRALRHLLHPLHNEFQGCADAMDIIQQASQGLLSHQSHPGIGQGPSAPSMSLEEALRVRPPYKEVPGSGQSFTARTSSERLFRGDVCRLGKCPDFRVSITTSNDVDVEDEVIKALMALDWKCRSWNAEDELTRAIKSTELPFGWKLQACTCRDNAVWMDPKEKIEVNVSRIFEVTGVSKPDEQSEDQNFELRLSSEELSEAVQRKDDGAWNHMEALLATVQMLHDSLRSEMGSDDASAATRDRGRMEKGKLLHPFGAPCDEDQLDSYRGERFNTEETALPTEGDFLQFLNDIDDDEDFQSDGFDTPELAGLREKIASHHLAVGVSLGTFEDFSFSMVSQGFEDLVGYSTRELQCKELTRLISRDCLTAFLLEQLPSLMGAWRHVVLRRKSGELADVVAMLQCIDFQGIHLFMCLEVLDEEAPDAAGERLVQKMQDLRAEIESSLSGQKSKRPVGAQLVPDPEPRSALRVANPGQPRFTCLTWNGALLKTSQLWKSLAALRTKEADDFRGATRPRHNSWHISSRAVSTTWRSNNFARLLFEQFWVSFLGSQYFQPVESSADLFAV
eukprot:s1117_g9.t1